MYPTGFVVSHATLTVHAIKLTLSVHEYSITIRVTTTEQTECQRWQHMQNGYQLIVCEVGVRGNRNTRRIASWVGENVEHSKLTLFLHAVWAVHCLVHTHGPSYEPSGVSAKRAYKRRGIVSDSHSINKAQEKYMQHHKIQNTNWWQFDTPKAVDNLGTCTWMCDPMNSLSSRALNAAPASSLLTKC